MAEVFGLIGPGIPWASVQLDVGEAVRPTLALEMPLTTRPDRDAGWPLFVGELIRRRMCSPDKGAAALAWIGEDTYDLPGVPWLVRVQRSLDIKLIVTASGSIEAKAYLCLRPSFALA